MTAELWATQWTELAPALGNHLWQSTLVAGVAGLLTLTLQRQQARARYALWLAASVKFLVPFSWLVSLGSRFTWWRTAEGNPAALYVAIEEVSQPFTQAVAGGVPRAVAPGVSPLVHFLPGLLAGLWLCGFAAVLVVWCVRWWRIAASISSSVPLREGREVEALRRVERATGLRQRIDLLLSQTMLEPGIFGVARPVLVWPEGISQRLEDSHLEAVLAHELWHVRRRDNLAAVLHMAVQALFWFHPLVWWLGARLVDERERACDEQVLELGSERQVYAESILKVCEFCVGSPLACVAGVTGADLKKRMVHIMSEQVARKLDFTRKVLISVAASLAIAAPILFGVVHATPGRAQSQVAVETSPRTFAFESVSIKPSEPVTQAGREVRSVRMMYSPEGYSAENVTLRALLQEAYGVQANQILGPPEFLDEGTYNVQIKGAPKESDEVNFDQRAATNRRLLQGVLADKFKLTLHRETKPLDSYALLVAEGGSKLQPIPAGDSSTGTTMNLHGILANRQMRMQSDGSQEVGVTGRGISLADLTRQLSMQLGRPVIDKTGLKGSYNFDLHWTGEAKPASADGNAVIVPDDEASATSHAPLFTALEEQLGLKLEPQKAPMEMLVIDHAEKAAEL